MAVFLIFDPLHFITYRATGAAFGNGSGITAGLISEMKIHVRDHLKFVERKIFILVLWFIVDLHDIPFVGPGVCFPHRERKNRQLLQQLLTEENVKANFNKLLNSNLFYYYHIAII